MKHFLKYIALLLLGFVLITTLLSIGSLYALRKSSLYKPAFLVNAVKQKDFDYIVLGSSIGLTTLNTKLLDSLNSIQGINLSMDDTGLSSQYLMLQHFLAEGKTTKYCILAPGTAALVNKTVDFGDNDYRFLMFVYRDYVYDYYKNASTNSSEARIASLSRWLPFLGISYYNVELLFPSLNALVQPTKRNRFDNKGNYSYPDNNKSFKKIKSRNTKLDFEHPYLKKIEALCKDNGIQLIYYFSPSQSNTVEYIGERFYVINDSKLSIDDSLFYDDIHVNSIGRKEITTKFARKFDSIKNLSYKKE